MSTLLLLLASGVNTWIVCIFTKSVILIVGIIVVILVGVIADGSVIAAIFAATLSAFFRNWIFCPSLNVIFVKVVPTILAFVKFVFVMIASARFALVRLAFVKSKLDRLIPERFIPDKS